MPAVAIDPALLPPPENRGHVYFGVLIGLGIPSLIAIATRTFVRIKYTKMWWDDYLMLLVVPLLVANHGMSLASINHGIGQHVLLLNPLDAMEAARLNTIAQPLNIWALFFVKASIVLFLVRLKPGPVYLYILWGTLSLLAAVTIEIFIVTVAQCQPLARSWNPTILEGFCWSANVFTYSAYLLSGLTILTDIVYITIPIFFLWNVQLNKKVKYAIWAVLGLGVVSMACSIAAIPFIYQLGLSTDPTYTIIELASVKSGELNVAILCACMPPIQPLFKHTGELISRFTRSGGSSGFSKGETWESRQKAQELSNGKYSHGSSKYSHGSSKYSHIGGATDVIMLKSSAGNMPSSTPRSPRVNSTQDSHYADEESNGGIVRTTDVNMSYSRQ